MLTQSNCRLVAPAIFSLVLLLLLSGCSTNATKTPDVAGSIRQSLDAANLKDVSVSQDRDKGVVTLGGKVAAQPAKAQAESIARSLAAGQVVANQIAVIPPGYESAAKTVNADLDKAIEANMDAALIQASLRKGVKYSVKNGVVTLTGSVPSEAERTHAQNVAAGVPNVQQVVNELQVKDQKASSSR
jgi:osmotically-inducible protein OsmY